MADPRGGRALLGDLLDLFLPVRCLGCGERVSTPGRAGPICDRCRTRVRPLPSPRCPRCDLPSGTRRQGRGACQACSGWPDPFESARCVTALAPPADALLHALKYEGWPTVVPFLAARMAALPLEVWTREPRVIVPVPTSRRRRRKRGYNQAELLAREVGVIRGVDCLEALVRGTSASSQIALPVAARRANVEGAFAPGASAARLPDSAHVILVDDVLTTGATAAAASEVLAAIGARSVTLLAFARTLPAELDTGASS